ncbi:MAG: hypothetical protein LQ350_005642 [Teloschistes chrysophthalmus]|nr:MAG: hypothetical protein LQ350_005642 [Niorma chrysophthalma]
MHIRLPIAIALSWALTTLSTPSQKNPQEAGGAIVQLQDLHDALEARGRIPINPLPVSPPPPISLKNQYHHPKLTPPSQNENGVNPSGSNPSGAVRSPLPPLRPSPFLPPKHLLPISAPKSNTKHTTNTQAQHPEGTAPCGTYLPEATDGPCGYWWLAAHPGYHRTTMTKTTVAMATVTATLTPPVVVETETRTVGG